MLYVCCLSPREAKAVASDSKLSKKRGEACPRIVMFTDPRLFRRLLTPLRLKLLSHLGSAGTPKSIHQLSRDLRRDYYTVLKDVELLAQFGLFSFSRRGPKGGDVPRVTWEQIRVVVSPSVVDQAKVSQRMPIPKSTKQALSLTRWVETLENAEDLKAVIQLGKEAYAAYWSRTPGSIDPWVDANIRCFATLLDRAFKVFDEKILSDLHECLELRGRFLEPALWEQPELGASLHLIAEDLIATGKRSTLLELLAISHDLEDHIRPNLVRLLWIAQAATGSQTKPYSASQLDDQGRVASIGYALDGLGEWLKTPGVGVLNPLDGQALLDLVESFRGTAPDQVSFDDMRNWISHRDFFLQPNGVTLNLHPIKQARRLSVEAANVTEWRRQGLGLMALLYAFKVMFLAHASARCGGIEPSFPPAIGTTQV